MGTDSSQSWLDALVNVKLDLATLIGAAIILLIGIVIARLVRNAVLAAMARTKADPPAQSIVARLAYWGILVMAVLTALAQIGVNVAALLAGLGIFGFALGFALQDVSKNFVSGLLLLMQKPFSVGEVIQVDEFTGWVRDIQLTNTQLETLDGQVVLIPSAIVFTNPIVNLSRSSGRRVELLINVDYKSDLEAVRRATLEAIGSLPGLKGDPAPSVSFQTFGNYSIQMGVFYWIDPAQTDMQTARDAGLRAVKLAFDHAGIEIPRPPAAPAPTT
jgi:small conductance mechanosensitive channel